MSTETRLKYTTLFTIAYLFVFSVMAVINENYEFLYYTLVMSVVMGIITWHHKRLHLQGSVMIGLTLVGFLHVAGGNIHLRGMRLYDIWLVKDVLKYDNFVHFVAMFVSTFVIYSLLYPHLDRKIYHNKFLLALLLILIASGLGTMNEILEFMAVLYLNAAAQVGDYVNNAFDLVFNLLGSATAVGFILKHHRRHNITKAVSK